MNNKHTNDLQERLLNGESASRLLDESLPTARRRFVSLTKRLKKLHEEISSEFPDAQIGCWMSGDISLFLGHVYNDSSDIQHDLVVASSTGLDIQQIR